jgi:hypothetical protein
MTIPIFALLLNLLSVSGRIAVPQTTQTLADVKRIFVEPMPNAFDQYLVAAISKELGKRVVIVTKQDDADAVLKGGTAAEAKGTPSTVARRILVMDLTTGAVSLISKDGRTVLWASEEGDKSVFGPFFRRTGARKVAERLAKDLKKALQH